MTILRSGATHATLADAQRDRNPAAHRDAYESGHVAAMSRHVWNALGMPERRRRERGEPEPSKSTPSKSTFIN